MAHTGVLQLEEMVARKERQLPSAISVVRDFFLDIFSHNRYLMREMESHTSHGRFVDAANYASQLGNYEHAFTLYNRAIAKCDWRANIPAAELAEAEGDYQRALNYRLNAKDYAHAGLDALHLGKVDEAQGYFRRLRDGD